MKMTRGAETIRASESSEVEKSFVACKTHGESCAEVLAEESGDEKPDTARAEYEVEKILGTTGELIREGNAYFYKVSLKSLERIFAGKRKDKCKQLVEEIISVLIAHDKKRFGYLKDSGLGTRGFNLRRFSSLLEAAKEEGSFRIPIPREKMERIVSEREFIAHCSEAVNEMLASKVYAEDIKKILESCSREDLLLSMVAVAKKESGGNIGFYSSHRWEPGVKKYSYSYFHILDDGPGLRARKKLGLSAGRTCDPKEGAMLFLAYMVEKNRNPSAYLPLSKGFESFASMYNGNWRARVEKGYESYPAVLRTFYYSAQHKIGSREILDKSEDWKAIWGDALASSLALFESYGGFVDKDFTIQEGVKKIGRFFSRNRIIESYRNLSGDDRLEIMEENGGLILYFQPEGWQDSFKIELRSATELNLAQVRL